MSSRPLNVEAQQRAKEIPLSQRPSLYTLVAGSGGIPATATFSLSAQATAPVSTSVAINGGGVAPLSRIVVAAPVVTAPSTPAASLPITSVASTESVVVVETEKDKRGSDGGFLSLPRSAWITLGIGAVFAVALIVWLFGSVDVQDLKVVDSVEWPADCKIRGFPIATDSLQLVFTPKVGDNNTDAISKWLGRFTEYETLEKFHGKVFQANATIAVWSAYMATEFAWYVCGQQEDLLNTGTNYFGITDSYSLPSDVIEALAWTSMQTMVENDARWSWFEDSANAGAECPMDFCTYPDQYEQLFNFTQLWSYNGTAEIKVKLLTSKLVYRQAYDSFLSEHNITDTTPLSADSDVTSLAEKGSIVTTFMAALVSVIAPKVTVIAVQASSLGDVLTHVSMEDDAADIYILGAEYLTPESNIGSQKAFEILMSRSSMAEKLVVTGSGNYGSNKANAEVLDECGYSPTHPASSAHVLSIGSSSSGIGGSPTLADVNIGGLYTSGAGFSKYYEPSAAQASIPPWTAPTGTISGYNADGRPYPDAVVPGGAFGMDYLGAGKSGGWVSGSTVSATSIAALAALIASKEGKDRLPQIKSTLYEQRFTTATPTVNFSQPVAGTTQCGNNYGLCCSEGFSVEVGWSPAQGVGTPSFDDLYAALT